MGTWSEEGRMVLSKIESLEKTVESLETTLNDMRVDMAVHDIKIGRSSAFYGAISGMVIAILTAIIINYVSAPIESKYPKVIYKEEKSKNEATVQVLD